MRKRIESGRRRAGPHPEVLFGTLLIILAPAGVLSAHDFWLAVDPFIVAPGGWAIVAASVGERFPVSTSATAADRIDQIIWISPTGERVVDRAWQPRPERERLVFDLHAPSAQGTGVLVLTVKPHLITLKPQDFTSYVTAEGLEAVVAERARRGESAKPGRERYARYAKALVRIGSATASSPTMSAAANASETRSAATQSSSTISAATREVGDMLALELVPERDPYTVHIGDRLPLRVLFRGKPLSGALVSGVYASSVGRPDEFPVSARTDAQGRVTISLAFPGPWLIRMVHMVRLDGAPDADWESFWGSLTFDLPAAARTDPRPQLGPMVHPEAP